jgi:CRP/FNR family cyclic AMP-dependent transcriptional regulator
MVHQLRARPDFAERFLSHMLTRNIRIEEDLVDQLFNSTEKRKFRGWVLGRFSATGSSVPRELIVSGAARRSR